MEESGGSKTPETASSPAKSDSTTPHTSQKPSASGEEFNAAAIFGRGLVSCIVPMVNSIDASIDDVRNAQVELSRQLQTLSESLRQTQDAEARGPDLDVYVKRLANCRRRLMVTGTLLNNIQSRMGRLHGQARKINEQQQQRSKSPASNSPGSKSGSVPASGGLVAG